MTKKQWWLIGLGIVLVAVLFVLRNQPVQDNPLEAYINRQADSLAEARQSHWQTLQQQWNGDWASPMVDSMMHFWAQQKVPGVVAIYQLRRAENQPSMTNRLQAAEKLMTTVKEAPDQLPDNMRFYFVEKAASLYQQVADEDSMQLGAQVGLAETFIEGKGQIMPGVQLLLKVLEKDSLYVPANLRLGRLSMVNGEYGNVIKRMHKVLQADSTHGEAYITIASAYRAMDENDSAVTYLEQALPYLNDTLRMEVRNRLKALKK